MSDIIDDIIDREGPATNDPNDRGGRTQYGISERTNPEAWADGQVTREEAEAIYRQKYVVGPHFNRIQDPKLQSLLVDWGVTSGPAIAIMALQRVVGVEADGVIGPLTLEAVSEYPAAQLVVWMVGERVKMIGRIVSRNPSQIKYLNGWLARSLEWL
jgi:lysozyme family protein